MKKTVTLLVLISMLFSTVFLFTGCGDSSVKEIKTADDIKGASVGVQTGTTGDTFVSDYEADQGYALQQGCRRYRSSYTE